MTALSNPVSLPVFTVAVRGKEGRKEEGGRGTQRPGCCSPPGEAGPHRTADMMTAGVDHTSKLLLLSKHISLIFIKKTASLVLLFWVLVNITEISSHVFRSPEEVLEPVEDLVPDTELGLVLPHRLAPSLLQVLLSPDPPWPAGSFRTVDTTTRDDWKMEEVFRSR